MATPQETNQAAWFDAQGQKLRVAEAEMPTAGPGEIVIRTRAAAVNPVDAKVQDYGLMVKTLPNILGLDVAGEVIEVGDGITRFKKGDRVTAPGEAMIFDEPKRGGYQLYTVLRESATGKIPDNISFAEAAVLPTAFDTALVALTAEVPKGLGLPAPSLNPKPSGKTIVIWGGSSSVGLITTQMAVAAGMRVITVASPRNFELVRSTGAHEVFDYNSDSVDEQVIKAVMSSGEEFGGILDTISTAQSIPHSAGILEKLGGGNLAYLSPLDENQKLPENVNAFWVFGHGPVTYPYWSDFLTPALEKGLLVPQPKPQVIGKGLEHVQTGIDQIRKGVSAAKLVIEL